MRGGNNAKPTALKELEGTVRRARVRNEPKPQSAELRIPRGMAEEARPYWRKIAPRLAKLGLLTELDVWACADMCLCFARASQAEKDIAERGILVAGDRGMVKNPAIQVARDYSARAWALAARFGMTPADRGRLSLPDAKAEDPFDEFLRESKVTEALDD